MYGSVAERADIEIEADSKEEAEKKALEMCEKSEVEFSENNESVDGWEYQVENIEELEK